MRYTISTNQSRALELGIKNVNQALIFDLLTTLSTWAEPEVLDGEVYYWIARQRIVDELPILDLKPDTVYRHLKAIEALGLIERRKSGKKDIVRLTPKGKTYLNGGNESEKPASLCRKQIRENSETNPTYPNTKDQEKDPPITPQGGDRFDQFWKAYPRKVNKPAAIRAFKRIKPSKSKLGEILQALERFKRSEQWTRDGGQFIPHPSTWLNGRRWEDEAEAEAGERRYGADGI